MFTVKISVNAGMHFCSFCASQYMLVPCVYSRIWIPYSQTFHAMKHIVNQRCRMKITRLRVCLSKLEHSRCESSDLHSSLTTMNSFAPNFVPCAHLYNFGGLCVSCCKSLKFDSFLLTKKKKNTMLCVFPYSQIFSCQGIGTVG